LPEIEGNKSKRQRFKGYPIGYVHIELAELRTNEGKLCLLVAIDRTSKFAVAQLVAKANRKTAREFLEAVLEAVPYKIHTILTFSRDHALQNPVGQWTTESSFVSNRATETRLIPG